MTLGRLEKITIVIKTYFFSLTKLRYPDIMMVFPKALLVKIHVKELFCVLRTCRINVLNFMNFYPSAALFF